MTDTTSPSLSTRITRFSVSGAAPGAVDSVAVEEPLEIVLHAPGSKPFTLAITMRTPGDDEALAAGFLFTEGLVKHRSDLVSLQRDPESTRPENTLIVTLARAPDIAPEQLHRHFFTHSACGVCGKTAMQALELRHQPRLSPGPQVLRATLQTLPEKLQAQQLQFSATGGVHASALFTAAGELLLLKEDVGRHNAMDKLIGHLLLHDQLAPAKNALVLVSGRSSFELVQKVLMADIPFLAAIGAPTSLAVQLAQRHGLTLAGFLKADGFNLYSAPERVA